MLDTRRIALATRCLWSLQEVVMEIEGLVLANIDGTTITSTLASVEGTQRLSAVSSTLFLLSEEATLSWKRGETSEVRLSLTDGEDEKVTYLVTLKPIADIAVLVGVYEMNKHTAIVNADIELAAQYLESLLSNDEEPPPITDWNSQ